MGTRTWPVFLVGLGSLLALLFLPGVTALRRTEEVYSDIRAIQEAFQASGESLAEIERRMYITSILVRDLLLDTSDDTGRYRRDFTDARAAIESQLKQLKEQTGAGNRRATATLESELSAYWASIEPVFIWTPEERAQRGTYFLREQQRPRRTTILAVAEELGALSRAAYKEQYEGVRQSQAEFRKDIERIVWVAFLLGTAIAGGTAYRISSLERRAERQRVKTERAEEELRSLSLQLMHAQEEERKLISRELHDQVGQMLTGLRMELGSLERLREQPEHFHEHLTESKTIAEQSLRAIRDLAVGLRPSVLDLGLLPALQWHTRHYSRQSGVRVTLRTEGGFDALPEAHCLCIYRVVQESLTNAARHASPSSVDVAVTSDRDGVKATIHDDGAGFEPTGARRMGLGLVGMEERVRDLGGSLKIESEIGKGTKVAVHLPLASGDDL
jgi:signal transduction histidine kinase